MSWREKTKQLKTEIYVLYLAFKDPRTPWYAKAFMVSVIAYFLSPIDLIPDFVPVLGYLDDLIIIPAGIYLALKMIPGDVREEYRQKAIIEEFDTKVKWIAAAVIIAAWLLVIYMIIKIILL